MPNAEVLKPELLEVMWRRVLEDRRYVTVRVSERREAGGLSRPNPSYES
jgi:hypothetical protein